MGNCGRSALDIIADYRKRLNDCTKIFVTAVPKVSYYESIPKTGGILALSFNPCGLEGSKIAGRWAGIHGGLNTSYSYVSYSNAKSGGSARHPIIIVSPFAGRFSLLTTDMRVKSQCC